MSRLDEEFQFYGLTLKQLMADGAAARGVCGCMACYAARAVLAAQSPLVYGAAPACVRGKASSALRQPLPQFIHQHPLLPGHHQASSCTGASLAWAAAPPPPATRRRPPPRRQPTPPSLVSELVGW